MSPTLASLCEHFKLAIHISFALGFELYWPYGNQVAQVIEGGEIACTNGFIHKIDTVLILQEDLKAGSAQAVSDGFIILASVLILRVARVPHQL